MHSTVSTATARWEAGDVLTGAYDGSVATWRVHGENPLARAFGNFSIANGAVNCLTLDPSQEVCAVGTYGEVWLLPRDQSVPPVLLLSLNDPVNVMGLHFVEVEQTPMHFSATPTLEEVPPEGTGDSQGSPPVTPSSTFSTSSPQVSCRRGLVILTSSGKVWYRSVPFEYCAAIQEKVQRPEAQGAGLERSELAPKTQPQLIQPAPYVPPDGSCEGELYMRPQCLTAVSVSPSGEWVVTGRDTGSVDLWGMHQILERLKAHGSLEGVLVGTKQVDPEWRWIYSVAITESAYGCGGSLCIAAATSEGDVHFLRAHRKDRFNVELVVVARESTRLSISRVVWSPCGEWLATCGAEEVINLWKCRGSEELFLLEKSQPYELSGCSWSWDFLFPQRIPPNAEHHSAVAKSFCWCVGSDGYCGWARWSDDTAANKTAKRRMMPGVPNRTAPLFVCKRVE